MTVPMYLAECAPVHLRGRLTVADNMAITGGQFAAAIIDYDFSYVSQGWRLVFVEVIISTYIHVHVATVEDLAPQPRDGFASNACRA